MNKTCRLIKNFLIIHFYLPTDSILGINNYWYDLLYYERKNKSVEPILRSEAFALPYTAE